MNDIDNSGCGPNFVEHFLYMTMENVPMWIQKIIDQNSWTKGKLNCPFCNVRIGSFNLMVETKCNCGTYVVSPIKLIQSKLDIMKTNENNHYAYSQASIARWIEWTERVTFVI